MYRIFVTMKIFNIKLKSIKTAILLCSFSAYAQVISASSDTLLTWALKQINTKKKKNVIDIIENTTEGVEEKMNDIDVLLKDIKQKTDQLTEQGTILLKLSTLLICIWLLKEVYIISMRVAIYLKKMRKRKRVLKRKTVHVDGSLKRRSRESRNIEVNG